MTILSVTWQNHANVFECIDVMTLIAKVDHMTFAYTMVVIWIHILLGVFSSDSTVRDLDALNLDDPARELNNAGYTPAGLDARQDTPMDTARLMADSADMQGSSASFAGDS